MLTLLLVVSVAMLVIPVTLQIISRYTALIPSYIWTEEMARFLFIWMVLIGAMVGVRESTHFEVDVWPTLSRRSEAAVRIRRGSAPWHALVFVWAGTEFTRFAWYRTSELAELPLWMIHIAWPAAGVTWIVFLGEQSSTICETCSGERHERLRFSPAMAALILFGCFFLFLALRVPVAFALGLACLPILVLEPRLGTMMLVQETFNAYNSFILLAVPFFLLTANLMNVGGITDRLVALSRALVGHCRAGSRRSTWCCRCSSPASRARRPPMRRASSKIFIEAQTREGYDLSFSVAITAVSAVLAVIIPPSILMIVWGGMLSISIGALFLAGIMPGLLIAVAQMATVHAYAERRGYPTYPRETSRAPLRHLVAIPALMTPVIIIGGKIFGWFTATELACVAVLYAGVLSMFVYREINMKGFTRPCSTPAGSAASRCSASARPAPSAGCWPTTDPRGAPGRRQSWGMGRGAGFFIAFVFLVVGCFLDAIPAIIIWAPILEPLAKAVDMDPVHFAMIGIVSLAFGLVTPPYGLCLMIACAVAGMRIRDAIKDTMIMLVPMILVLAAMIVGPRRALPAQADRAGSDEVIFRVGSSWRGH